MDENLDLNKNIEIEKALKEFEVKSTAEQIKEQNSLLPKNSELPGMDRLVMKLSGGLIKKQKQADYVLLGFTVITTVFTIFLSINAFNGPSETPADFRGNIPSSSAQ